MPRRLTSEHRYNGWRGVVVVVVVVEDGMKLVLPGEWNCQPGHCRPPEPDPWAKGAETAVLVL